MLVCESHMECVKVMVVEDCKKGNSTEWIVDILTGVRRSSSSYELQC